jgi:hypothetical protein
MAARSIASLTASFGLVSIPVKRWRMPARNREKLSAARGPLSTAVGHIAYAPASETARIAATASRFWRGSRGGGLRFRRPRRDPPGCAAAPLRLGLNGAGRPKDEQGALPVLYSAHERPLRRRRRRIVPASASEALAAAIPGAELHRLPGEGHFAVFDRYWQVFFDTHKTINDVGGEAGCAVPESRVAMRNVA